MKVLLTAMIALLFVAAGHAQQGPDYIVTVTGDTIFCDIMEDRSLYRPKKHEVVATRRRSVIVYNGFHGIIARGAKDSIYYFEAYQVKSYYQHNAYHLRGFFSKQIIETMRPQGMYEQIDLGEKKNHLKAGYQFRFLLACPATEELLAYPIRYNAPYELFFAYLVNSDGEPIDCYILKRGKEYILLGLNAHLRAMSKKYGIDPKLWRVGGGSFKAKVLRFHFALNNKASE